MLHDPRCASTDGLIIQNILVQNSGPDWWIKIADFGITKRIHGSTDFRTVVGTEGYIAPEVKGIMPKETKGDRSGSYTYAVDIWSVGIVAWRMMTRQLAFATLQELISYVCFEESPAFKFEGLSNECCEFIKRMLAASPDKRPTSQEALGHPWIRQHDLPTRGTKSGAFTQPLSQRGLEETNPIPTQLAEWTTRLQSSHSATCNASPRTPDHDASSATYFEKIDEEVFQGYYEKGCEMFKRGNYEESVRMHLRSLDGRIKALGELHASTLKSRFGLGWALSEQGKYQEATQEFYRVLDGRRKILGPTHEDTFHCSDYLGYNLRLSGRYQEAEQIYRIALDGKAKVSGETHMDTLHFASGLAKCLELQQRHKESEKIYQRVFEGRVKVLGETHRRTLNSAYGLAWSLDRQDKYKKAEEMYRRSLDGRAEALGEIHEDTLGSVCSLGRILYKQKRYKEAETMYQRAVDGMRALDGSAEVSGVRNTILACMEGLELVYRVQGKDKEAKLMSRQRGQFKNA